MTPLFLITSGHHPVQHAGREEAPYPFRTRAGVRAASDGKPPSGKARRTFAHGRGEPCLLTSPTAAPYGDSRSPPDVSVREAPYPSRTRAGVRAASDGKPPGGKARRTFAHGRGEPCLLTSPTAARLRRQQKAPPTFPSGGLHGHQSLLRNFALSAANHCRGSVAGEARPLR